MGLVRLGLGCTHHSTRQFGMLNRITYCQLWVHGFPTAMASNRMGQSWRIWSRLGLHVGAIMSVEDLLDLTRFGWDISEISINPQILAEHIEERRSVKVEGICQSDQACQILRRKPATIRFWRRKTAINRRINLICQFPFWVQSNSSGLSGPDLDWTALINSPTF